MATLKETREMPVEDIVIRLADLKFIAGHLFSEHKNTSNDNRSDFDVKIIREDGVSFESRSLSILNDDSPVLDHRLISIEMSYKDFDKQRSIKIEIHHGNWVASRNKIRISGMDSIWVNGQLKFFENILNRFEKQNNFFLRLKTPIAVTLSFIFAVVASYLFAIIKSPTDINTEFQDSSSIIAFIMADEFLYFLITFFIFFAISGIPSVFLVFRMHLLWPSVEIQVGPEHRFREKIQRKRLYTSITLLLIPLIIGTFFFIVSFR